MHLLGKYLLIKKNKMKKFIIVAIYLLMDTVMEGVDACFFRPDGVQTETMRAIRSILDQSGSVSAKNWSDPSFSISKFCVAVGELCKACPIRQAVTEAFKTKKDFSNLETTVSLRLSDKKTFKCNVAVSGSYMNIHNRPEMLITIHDITELKQAQIRLQDALDKTERIEKSKFMFLEKLSNEINDQLNCILGWTNLVSTDKTLTPDQQSEYMNLIYEHSDHLSHLANDVLRLARIDCAITT